MNVLGQVVTLGLESVLIGNPGQSDPLALGGDEVGRSAVGVSLVGVAGVVFAVGGGFVVAGGKNLLGVGLFAGCAVRSLVAFFYLQVKSC